MTRPRTRHPTPPGRAHPRPPAATLRIDAAPDLLNVRTVTVDCEHGVTTLAIGEGEHGPRFSDQLAASVAVMRHHEEEGCACTAELRRRYGVAPFC